LKILYLGDISGVALISGVFSLEGIFPEVRFADTIDIFRREFRDFKPDAVLADYTATSAAAKQLLYAISGRQVKVPFIAITSAACEDLGIEAVKQGAHDYVLIEAIRRIPIAVHNSLELVRLKEEKHALLRERIKSGKKLLQANRIYAVISSINRAVISIDNEQALFKEACRIATEVGGFKVALIGMLDTELQTLDLAEGAGIRDNERHLFKGIQYDETRAQDLVVRTGKYFVCNDIEQDLDHKLWKKYAIDHGIGSFIILPIRKAGEVVCSFILGAEEKEFFNAEEIALLEDAANDISFRLDIFEKDKAKALADEKLKLSEIRLKQAQASAHLGSWELDFATGVAEWSEEALSIYGLPLDDNKQSYEIWMSFIHPEDLSYVIKAKKESSNELSVCKLRHRILRKDGSIRHILSESHYVLNNDGQPVGLHGTSLDITDIIQAQEALRESELRYSTLFDMSPQPGWLYDPETYRFVQVNKAAIEHYGYSEEEFLSMTIWDIRPEEDFSGVRDAIKINLNRQQIIHTRKFRHFKKSGELIDVDIYSNAIVLKDKPYRLIIAIDSTEKNSYENKMTAAIIQTQEDERNEIGAELHDNVCQILASTLLKLSLLQADMPAEAMKSFRQIRNNITLATKEIRNISHRLAPASFDDSTLKESLRLLLNTYNASKKYNIALHYDSRIDEYPLSQSVKLNLYRIIQEQLSNILKHSSATEISIRLALHQACLKLSVTDNGKGCNVHDTKSGIGLANMRRRIQLFAGNLEIASIPGEGYQIEVEIPVQKFLPEMMN
jgi:PAS domain S-box-containing protein